MPVVGSAASTNITEGRLWAQVPAAQWGIHSRVLRRADELGLPLAIGGGFAYSHYAQRWRDTKDLDLFVLPADRDRFVDLLSSEGLEDFHDAIPYDRGWIYRSRRDGTIIDVIWQMANRRAVVDSSWFERAVMLDVRDARMRLVSVEDLIWTKLYVMQRDRCDWPDLLSILAARVDEVDWTQLLRRAGPDGALLGGLVSTFAWLCPAQAARIPRPVWGKLGLVRPKGIDLPTSSERPVEAAGADVTSQRMRFLDTREWFGPSL